MKPLTILLILFLVTVVVIGIVVNPCVLGGDECDEKPEVSLTPVPGSITISMASSITKWEWLEQAVEVFNQNSKSDSLLQVNGDPIHVQILLEKDPLSGRERHWNSPTQVQATLRGDIEPTILSPASSTWIAKLNKDWPSSDKGRSSSAGTNEELVTGESPSLLSTPVVIAMWESRARALGCWPISGPDCTWKRIRELAVDPDGWGSVGHPEWGAFHFGYAYVGESDVGTQTAALVCMMGLGKFENLSVDEITTTNGCGEAIEDVESVLVHRGTSSPLILNSMLAGGPSFLDAVTTYEKNVIGFNKANPSNFWGKLVSIYPQDGTVIADHQFAILDKAPWVTEDKIRAAKIFRDYLFTSEQQNLLLGYGIRPNDPNVRLGSPIDITNGASAESNLEAIDVPSVQVVDQVVEIWRKLKKSANVCLVFDKSGSMNGSKIGQALIGATQFVQEMDSNDWLCWQPFDTTVYSSTQGLKSQIGEELEDNIRSTSAKGQTALYDAIKTAFINLEERQHDLGDTVRYGIVVLSDGQDSGSDTTLAELESLLRPNESDISGIQVHLIGIGGDADDAVLTKIAGFSHGGRYWKVTDPSTIEAVYKRISKYW